MMGVADTGFVVAVMNRRDNHHQQTSLVYQQAQKIYLPQTTLAEVAYLLQSRVSQTAVADFLEKLPFSKLIVTPILETDLQKTALILRQYTDSRIDFVDATVMAIAERLNISTIFTVDRRDFQLYRPTHIPFFTILPE